MTYTIRPGEIVNGDIKVVVDFVDGNLKYDKSFFPQSIDDLKRNIQNELDRVSKNQSLLAEINKGIADLTTTPISQAELDKKIWFDKYAKYQQLLQAVTNGFLKADDPSISSLLADLKATYKPEYGVF